jgi:hypothetical protein
VSRSLTHLTDAQLDEAFELFKKLVADTGRASGRMPGPAWDSVYERLEEGLNDYRAEVAHRSQPSVQTQVATPASATATSGPDEGT